MSYTTLITILPLTQKDPIQFSSIRFVPVYHVTFVLDKMANVPVKHVVVDAGGFIRNAPMRVCLFPVDS